MKFLHLRRGTAHALRVQALPPQAEQSHFCDTFRFSIAKKPAALPLEA